MAALRVVVAMMFLPDPPAHVVHVAPDGSDSAAGTAAAPFRTISRAARDLAPGSVCRIRPGRYAETVVVPTSGTGERPIRFEAGPDAAGKPGPVIIDGTEPVTGWKKEGDLWTAPYEPHVSSLNRSDDLFMDERRVLRSQWPDPGPDLSRPVRATLDRFISKKRDDRRYTVVVFEDDALKAVRAEEVVGGEIFVQPNDRAWSWALTGRVVSLDGARITIESRADTGKDGQQDVYAVGSRYTIFPRKAFLGPAAAYIADRDTKMIRLRLPAGDSPEHHRFASKRRDLGFDLSGRSFVTLTGLDLRACNLTTDRDSGGDSVGFGPDGAERFPWRPKDWIGPSEGIRLDRLDVTYPDSVRDLSGHFFFQYGNNSGLVLAGANHTVSGCRVRFADVNAITLSGRGHRAIGNVIEDANLTAVDGAAISTAPSGPNEDIEIAWNTIRRTGRSGIGLRGWCASSPALGRARLHHNDVRDFMMQDWDGGGFYCIGQDGRFARIDHNLFRIDSYRAESMVFGLYFDFSKNYIADHNVVLGTVTPIQVTKEYDPGYSRVNNLVIVNNTAIPNGGEWGRPYASSLGRGSIAANNLMRVATWRKPDGGTINHWPEYGTEGVGFGNVLYGDDPGGYYARAERMAKGDHYVAGIAWDAKADLPTFALPAAASVPTIEREGWTVPKVATPWVGAIEPGRPMFAVGAPPFRSGRPIGKE